MIQKRPDLKILWICAAKFQFEYLIEKGWAKDDILLLNWEIISSKKGETIGEYKLNELVYGDRVLKYRKEEGKLYLSKIQSIFYDFVVNKDIKYIFGEITWAHEILMSRICLDKFKDNCVYLHPQSIRIPNGRFTFMDTEFQDSIYKKAEYFHDTNETKSFDIPIQPTVPQRVAEVEKDVMHSLTLKYKITRILNFIQNNRIKNRPNDNLQTLRLSESVKKFFTTIINQKYYTKILKKTGLSELEGKKFFFLTLHMQPEASIDVVGRYYDNQFLLIRDVWRILPNDYALVIKEHTNAIGNRGKEFFKNCLSLNNVIVVDEKASSHKLINMCETIFTNSGTVALEGALYKKDVFLFSGIFFDKLKYCHRISLEDLKYSSNYFDLLQKCKTRDQDKMTVEAYSDYIIRSSFSGVIDGHKGSYYYTDTKNIETIAEGFMKFIYKIQ